MGPAPLWEEAWESFFSLLALWLVGLLWDDGHLQTRKPVLPRHSDLGLPSLCNHGKCTVVEDTLSLVICHSSPNKLKQTSTSCSCLSPLNHATSLGHQSYNGRLVALGTYQAHPPSMRCHPFGGPAYHLFTWHMLYLCLSHLPQILLQHFSIKNSGIFLKYVLVKLQAWLLILHYDLLYSSDGNI